MSQIGEVVEMLHNASLMIDDIEDDSILRRGIPVAHKIYGVPHTINSANYVYFLGLQKVCMIVVVGWQLCFSCFLNITCYFPPGAEFRSCRGNACLHRAAFRIAQRSRLVLQLLFVLLLFNITVLNYDVLIPYRH